MPLLNQKRRGETRPSSDAKMVGQRFLALIQDDTDVFWVLTPDGQMCEVSQSWQAFTGQQARESRGQGWRDALHPADSPEIEGVLLQAMTTRHASQATCQVRSLNDTYRTLALRIIPVSAASHEVSELLICGKDITRRKLRLRMSQAQAQLALKTSQVGMWDWDVVADRLTWTDQTKALFGLPADVCVTYQSFLASVHPEDRERVDRLNTRALGEQGHFRAEYRVVWPDGSIHWLTDRAKTVYNSRGKAVHLVGATIDITDLKQAEEALRESETRFHRFVNSNIIGITISSLEGPIYEANDAFLEMTGYTREDLAAGKLNWVEMTRPEDLVYETRVMEEIRQTGVFQPFEKEYLTRDNKYVPVLVGGTVFHKNGDPTSQVLQITFVLDLSAQKALEQQKDLFLSMASHELKTPLAALKGTLQLAERRTKRLVARTPDLAPEMRTFIEDLSRHLTTSIRQVDLQAHLINDLLDISRIRSNALKLSLQSCDLAGIVRETVTDMRLAEPGRELYLEIPEGQTVSILADPERISQVLTNYLTNAVRYSGAEKPVHIGLDLAAGHARVRVSDQGRGLSVEDCQRIWQPFHKAAGGAASGGSGQGLGLYICQTLIALHHGTVGVDSEPGQGSTFWFTLPLLT